MSKIYKIITIPDPILRKKAVKFDLTRTPGKELKKFCADMAETMLAADGVGLAAPQVGKSVRFAVINTKNGPLCLVNPEITKKSWAREWGQEGCLSVPEVYGEVKRHKKIECRYTDQERQVRTVKAEGLMARVIQHEVDHLDGVLFIDKMRPIKNKERLNHEK